MNDGARAMTERGHTATDIEFIDVPCEVWSD